MDTITHPTGNPAAYKQAGQRSDIHTKDNTPMLFKMRAPLLDQGRSNHHLTKTDNMWVTLKVYASGGENGLHTHPNEDHTFIVMSGSARYYGPDGVIGDRNAMEGIMIPAGAYYWFEATSKEPLVLLRVGCRVGPQNPSGRLNIRGEEMPGDHPDNKQVAVKVREGAFFGA